VELSTVGTSAQLRFRCLATDRDNGRWAWGLLKYIRRLGNINSASPLCHLVGWLLW